MKIPVLIKTSSKRFHIYGCTASKTWVCFDQKTGAVGLGDLPKRAYDDCQIEIEIMTSDIHQ